MCQTPDQRRSDARRHVMDRYHLGNILGARAYIGCIGDLGKHWSDETVLTARWECGRSVVVASGLAISDSIEIYISELYICGMNTHNVRCFDYLNKDERKL